MHRDMMAVERARLVRLCTQLTGDAQAAEDVVQEVLVIAWQQEHTLRDPDKRAQWLAGIARNLCRHWLRRQGLERRHAATVRDGTEMSSPYENAAAAADSLDATLERHDLITLLDRALAMLPVETRRVLISHYVHDTPHTEIAARLSVSEDAVKKRVERGKRVLKRVLTTTFQQEAVAYGLMEAGPIAWQETSLWCPGCGRRRLAGYLKPQEGELVLSCPACSSPHSYYINARLQDFNGLRTYKPAVSRVLRTIHDLFHVRAVDGALACPGCARSLLIRQGIPPVPTTIPRMADGHGESRLECLYILCPHCGLFDAETWHSLTWSLPQARRFWRDHPRMRFLPAYEIEACGQPAVVTRFESLTGAARLEVLALRDTFQVLSLTGSAAPDRVGDDECA